MYSVLSIPQICHSTCKSETWLKIKQTGPPICFVVEFSEINSGRVDLEAPKPFSEDVSRQGLSQQFNT